MFVCGSLDLKCRLILEWTLITSPPASLLSGSYQLVSRAQETGKHKIIHNKCSNLRWTLAKMESVISLQFKDCLFEMEEVYMLP